MRTTLRLAGTAIIATILLQGCITKKETVTSAKSDFTTDDKYTQLMFEFQKEERKIPEKSFTITNSGLDTTLDYTKYGTFHGIGTNEYKYVIKDEQALMRDIGVGIFPDFDGVVNEEGFKEARKLGKLKHQQYWSYLTPPIEAQPAFYVWATASASPGTKCFFLGRILEESGHLVQALKAYHASIVHFPRNVCYSADASFVWYTAPAAASDIRRICALYPHLGLEYVDGNIEVINGKDLDLSNDIIKVNPGRFVKKIDISAKKKIQTLKNMKVIETRGKGKVQLVKYSNGHWQMLVDGKPFVVRGVSYSPTEIGRRHGKAWVFTDKNKNGLIDAPEEAWVDKNGNNIQDKDEVAVGDFQLLKDMGCNTIRYYYGGNRDSTKYNPATTNKALLRKLTTEYGIKVAFGHFTGAYTVGSGASYSKGTDYTNQQQRDNIKNVVLDMVRDLKDEPFILLWILGNENNMPSLYKGVNATRTNASKHPEAYASLLNEIAEEIHKIDPNHPVAVGNTGLGLAKYYSKHAPAIDIFGINAYRGKQGFGDLWKSAKKKFDRPIIITEYGCDAYFNNRGVDEEGQAEYHGGCIRDIVLNQAGGYETGNSIGSIIFEYLDEWWKDTHSGDSWSTHQTKPQFPFPFPDGQSHEEWFGIVGQGDGKHSPFKRNLRKAYFLYKDIWSRQAGQ